MKIKLIAHRGLSSLYLENSKEAIINAIDKKEVDGVEIDIRMTKDKKFVLVHDPSLKKITENSSLNIRDLTYEELLKYDLISNKSIKINSIFNSFLKKDGLVKRKRKLKLKKMKSKIILLEEILPLFNNKKVIIEIKSKENEYEDLEYQLDLILQKYKNIKFSIKSFNYKSIKNLKEINSNYEVGALISNKKGLKALNYNFDFVSVKYKLLKNNDLIEKLNKSNKELLIWTVNDYKTLKKVSKYLKNYKKEYSLITDYPDLIYKYIY